MNKIILIGRTTREVEVRTTQTGKTVARVGLAVDRQNKKNAQAAGQQTADFFNLTAWDRTAQIMQQYVTKGTQIAIEGHVQTGTYEKDGVKRATFDVQVDRLELLGSKKDAQQGAVPQGYAQPQQAYQQAPTPIPPQAPAPQPQQPVAPAPQMQAPAPQAFPPPAGPMPDDDILF